ncbi:acetyltransferase [Paucibacter sp. M5-1]|uniref:acetyltransferase n=1 Tax=Paucibacter sp. M5-1 TaxID=3015998 RepID=UPI0022B8A88F|nr:acetyltransferase [Paucibacter sp. M5-1]MCZ7879632.1 acetyltransferase [Paucibacter sp. M5-1]
MTHAKNLPLVLIGAGGHAKVVLSLARALGRDVVGVCDPALAREGATTWRGIRVLGDDEALSAFDVKRVGLLNGIGQVPHGTVRQAIHDQWTSKGFLFVALAHPRAVVDPTARLGHGAQVMAGVIVQADVTIGASTIVNTGAHIDHDCRIGDHVHVAPGAVLCGGVDVGAGSFLGAGCVVLQQVTVGASAIVSAGTVLARALAAGSLHAPHRRLPPRASESSGQEGTA